MKLRIDTLLVEHGFAESREQAQRLIMAGSVYINNSNNIKAGHKVNDDVAIRVVDKERYVSRGGLKLEGALENSQLSVENKICADIGTSTGGFTDCLLQHGARLVYAVDVGKTQIHEKLRDNPQVILCENMNAKFLTETTLPDKPDVIVIDVSFISLTKILHGVYRICHPNTRILALVKPQFEATIQEVGKNKGIIINPLSHFKILCNVVRSACDNGFVPIALYSCKIKGSRGNHEWFIHMGIAQTEQEITIDSIVDKCKEACRLRWNDTNFDKVAEEYRSSVKDHDL